MKEGELVLIGQPGSTRAAVVMDEDGKARLNVGKPGGLSTDIKVSTDEVGFLLKYKRGFTIDPRPKRR